LQLTLAALADYMSSYEGVEYTSRPMVTSTAGQEQTLLQTLQQILPHCFQSGETSAQTSTPSETVADENKSTSDAIDATTRSSTVQGSHVAFLEQYHVLVAGITPPLQTPISWLHATLHAPDLFLYITVFAQQ